MLKKTFGLAEIDSVARAVMNAMQHKVITLKGPMGAGKTTFIKSLCKQMGIQETISSPTFSLVNMYQQDEITVYHFDCYRLNTAEEALDFGAEEYLHSKDYCFVEWPEIIDGLLPEKRHQITITPINDHTRELVMQ